MKRPHSRSWILQLVHILVLLPSFGSCSSGDRNPDFASCVSTCWTSGCVYAERRHHGCVNQCKKEGAKPDFFLNLFGWDCLDDCRYSCMWAMEKNKKQYNTGGVEKYYGKWPFHRVLGMQELCAVITSVGNFLALYINIIRFLSRTKLTQQQAKQMYPYTWLWTLQVVVNMNSWVWSSVFHSRDNRLTEKFDYFSADLVALSSLYIALMRVFRPRYEWRVLLAASGLLFLLRHMYWMTYIKFDYGYNVMICLFLGVSANAILLGWAWVSRHPGKKILTAFMLGLHTAMLFEILDFAPFWGLLDAHAVWHLATIPLTYVWFAFLNTDLQLVCKAPAEKDTQ